MICPACGAKNRQGARFCRTCGRPIDELEHEEGRERLRDRGQAEPGPGRVPEPLLDVREAVGSRVDDGAVAQDDDRGPGPPAAAGGGEEGIDPLRNLGRPLSGSGAGGTGETHEGDEITAQGLHVGTPLPGGLTLAAPPTACCLL